MRISDWSSDVCSSDLVAFTDADCRPASDWLEKALAAAGRHPDAGVLAGRISLFEEGEAEGPVFTDYERLFSFPQSLAARGNCATAHWTSPRTICEELGGFSHHLKSGGDSPMARRIRDTGRPLLSLPEIQFPHSSLG